MAESNDPNIRLHERLDDITNTQTATLVAIAEIKGATKQHADDMAYMREEFAKRDIRAQVLRDWGTGEISRIDKAVAENAIAIEKDHSFIRGISAVLSVLFALGGTYFWTLVDRVAERINSFELVVHKVEDLKSRLEFIQKIITKKEE